jgi:hypothetical protein
MRRCREILIAASASSASSDHDAFIRLSKIMYQLARLFVIDQRTDRYLQHDAFAVAPRSIRAFAMTAALCFVFWIESEVNERIVFLARFHDHIAATSAVAARWTTAGNELRSQEGSDAVATSTSCYADFRFIYKHSCVTIQRLVPRAFASRNGF